LSISYLTPSFLDILIQEFRKLKIFLSDKKLLDNTTYKKLSILSDKMLSFKEVVDAKKKKLKDEGKEDSYEYRRAHIFSWSEQQKWRQCTFPRRGYPMEKDSKWRSKNDSGLRFYVRQQASEGFEKGDIMIKDPEKWYDWQLRALYIMYPDHKDVMQVLVKKHLADWGIPSSPLERSDMRNKEEAFINELIRTTENDQPSFERMDLSISGGESKNQSDDEKSLLDTELKTLLWHQKTVDEDIDNLKQKLAKAEASSKKLKDKIKKKQKELRKEKRMEERRKRMTELAAELERLKRLNEEDEDSSDEELEEIEVEEPDFPGEDEIEGWSHEALEQWDDVDFYIDEENNIWDENMEFVGTYHGWNDTISFKEDYEPEE
jgi:hypothetical protein